MKPFAFTSDQGESVRAVKRLSTVVLFVLAAAILPGAAAQAAVPAAGVQITVGHSNKCLNVQGASTANSAKIVQYTCSATATNDKFKLVPKGAGNYWIQGIGSGKCFNVQGNSTANSAAIIQYTCATSLNTLWKVQEVPDKPTIRLVSASSGKCLNVQGGSTANSAAIIQYTCTTSTTALNEQFYLPPTTSATATHRAFTSQQPIAVRQGAAPGAGAVAPVYYSWISQDNQLTILADRNPDPDNTDPNAPEPVYSQSSGFGYTGRTYSAPLQDGRVQVVAHDAAAGDTVLADETTKGTGEFGDLPDIGGAFAGQPVVGPLAPNGSLAAYALVGGALWYAPETVNNPQTPYGAWRLLDGTGLTGTPVVVPSAAGARIFALNTAGQLQTAILEGGALSAWTNLGGTGLNGVPSVVVSPGPRYSIFVRSGDGMIVTKKSNLDGTFPADWATVGDFAAAGSPTAVLNDIPARIAVAIRGADDLIYFAYENGEGTASFSDWALVSDPEGHPETIAASDPTAFTYNVPSGPSFGIAFQSTDGIDLPVVVTFESAQSGSALARNATPKGEFHRLTKPGAKARLAG